MTCDNIEVDIQNLRIGTFNLRGFKNSFKQDALLKTFKDQKLNIIALQETHLENNEIQVLRQKWQGPIYHSDGTAHSKGLCILFDNYFQNYKIELVIKNERILLCSCCIDDNLFFFCNIYAPNEVNSKINFFTELNALLTNQLVRMFQVAYQ